VVRPIGFFDGEQSRGRRANQRVLLLLLRNETAKLHLGRSGKPITNFIDAVVGDLSKLSAKSGPTSTGLVAWMAYPIPEPLPRHWPEHVLKVQTESASTLRSEKIAIWKNNFAHLYIMQCR
jgi:hypothetical protein